MGIVIMTMTLLERWLDHFDPIHRGLTPDGIVNGALLTNGFGFPRIRGGYNLRRSECGVPDESARIVGAAGADASSIDTFPWLTHSAGVTYTYRLTSVGGGGVDNLADEVTADVGFDNAGDWCGNWPNPPADLSVWSRAGGRMELRWTYTREDEQAEPATFNVYHDSGTGVIDFDTVVGSVAYHRGQFHYRYESEAFPEGARIRWAVRAVSSVGTKEPNDHAVLGRARVEPPPINPSVVITRVGARGW
jgi:hypothetical protein